MYAQRRLIIEAIIAAGLGKEQIWTCPGPDDYPVLLSRRALTKVFIGVIIPGFRRFWMSANGRIMMIMLDDCHLFRPNAQLKIAIISSCTNNCPICFRNTRCQDRTQSGELCYDEIADIIDQGAAIGFVGAY